MIKIKKIHGLDLFYDERMQRFCLYDGNAEIGFAATQSEAERKAKIHSRQKFSRVAIITFGYDNETIKGELTSYNVDDESAWVSMEKGSTSYGSGRTKLTLSYSHSHYEATEKNLKLAAEIEAKGLAAKALKAEAEELKEQLEKPINLEYFGIKKR